MIFVYSPRNTTGSPASMASIDAWGYPLLFRDSIAANLTNKIPEDSLSFYAPLSTASSVVETAQSFNIVDTVGYSEIDGIPCAYFNGNSYIYSDSRIVQEGGAFSISLWVRSLSTEQVKWGFCIGDMSTPLCGIGFGVRFTGSYTFIVSYNDDENSGIAVDTQNWVHLAHVYDGSIGRTYVNGVLARSFTNGSLTLSSGWAIGARNDGIEPWYGYFSSVRVYNKALTSTEVVALSREFDKTSQGLPYSGLLLSALPDPSWTAGQTIYKWGDFIQYDTSKCPEIATINGVTGIKAREGDELVSANVPLSGNFTFIAKIYIGDTENVFTLLRNNTWNGPIIGFIDIEGSKDLILSWQGVSAAISTCSLGSLGTGVYTIAVTFNSGTGAVKFYINGSLQYTDTYTPDFSYSPYYSYSQEGTSNNLLLGLAVYNKELSANNIAAIRW